MAKIYRMKKRSEVKKNGKRKKEGIFYTPEYITRYIVKESIGGWLDDRKKELGFYELPELSAEDYQSIKLIRKKISGSFANTLKYNNKVEKHLAFWEAYKEKLRNIKVLDPACGSGAFLNQAFDFLYNEGQFVNDKLSALRLGQREIFELDKHILTNNIFGVDLNAESVEITKLSLWLKTANKGKELTALDDDLKCGNSLIDNPAIAGDKAFNWFLEFPRYLKKKIKKHGMLYLLCIIPGTVKQPDGFTRQFQEGFIAHTYPKLSPDGGILSECLATTAKEKI